MKFSYKKYNGILRPVIPIKLKNKNKEIGYQVLVDSGADFSLFNAEIGEAIGIDVKSGELKTIFGVGGKTSLYYLHTIIIEVGDKDYEIEAGFMPDVAGRIMPYGLVGQRGFFENFIVRFDLLKEEIDLKNR